MHNLKVHALNMYHFTCLLGKGWLSLITTKLIDSTTPGCPPFKALGSACFYGKITSNTMDTGPVNSIFCIEFNLTSCKLVWICRFKPFDLCLVIIISAAKHTNKHWHRCKPVTISGRHNLLRQSKRNFTRIFYGSSWTVIIQYPHLKHYSKIAMYS